MENVNHIQHKGRSISILSLDGFTFSPDFITSLHLQTANAEWTRDMLRKTLRSTGTEAQEQEIACRQAKISSMLSAQKITTGVTTAILALVGNGDNLDAALNLMESFAALSVTCTDQIKAAISYEAIQAAYAYYEAQVAEFKAANDIK